MSNPPPNNLPPLPPHEDEDEDDAQEPEPEPGDENQENNNTTHLTTTTTTTTQTNPHTDSQSHPTCEYTQTCRTTPPGTSPNLRKVISHIFGRNKRETKRIPDTVWVHYCRKHYQRARYRSMPRVARAERGACSGAGSGAARSSRDGDEKTTEQEGEGEGSSWAITQCDLIFESLRRMETWGGVEGFRVVLRRREEKRISVSSGVDSKGSSGDGSASSGGKRRRGGGRGGSTPSGRKKPKITAAPVPDWLVELIRGEEELGETEYSFDCVRDLVGRIRADLAGRLAERKKDAGGEVMFPDIEILPNLREVPQPPTPSSFS